jgi:hypothetical protein
MISFIIEILESESYYYFIVLPGFYKMIPNVKEILIINRILKEIEKDR